MRAVNARSNLKRQTVCFRGCCRRDYYVCTHNEIYESPSRFSSTMQQVLFFFFSSASNECKAIPFLRMRKKKCYHLWAQTLYFKIVYTSILAGSAVISTLSAMRPMAIIPARTATPEHPRASRPHREGRCFSRANDRIKVALHVYTGDTLSNQPRAKESRVSLSR